MDPMDSAFSFDFRGDIRLDDGHLMHDESGVLTQEIVDFVKENVDEIKIVNFYQSELTSNQQKCFASGILSELLNNSKLESFSLTSVASMASLPLEKLIYRSHVAQTLRIVTMKDQLQGRQLVIFGKAAQHSSVLEELCLSYRSECDKSLLSMVSLMPPMKCLEVSISNDAAFLYALALQIGAKERNDDASVFKSEELTLGLFDPQEFQAVKPLLSFVAKAKNNVYAVYYKVKIPGPRPLQMNFRNIQETMLPWSYLGCPDVEDSTEAAESDSDNDFFDFFDS